MFDVIVEWMTIFGKMLTDGETDEVMVELARWEGKYPFDTGKVGLLC